MGWHFKPRGGRGEFFLVLAGAFGIFVVASVRFGFGFSHWSGHSNVSLASTTAYELALLGILGFVLHRRGWTLRGLGFDTHWSDLPVGVGLALTAWCFYVWGFWILAAVFPHLMEAAAHTQMIKEGLSPWGVWPLVCINHVYEELFVSGYVICSLKDNDANLTAINASVAIRLTYHLYQGVVAVAAMLPLGLVFAYWFARTRRIWPLIIAHAILDFLAFYPRIGV